MKIIEIKTLSNGAHRNQQKNGEFATIPEGWAVIPEEMECENFPFGEVEAEKIDGVMTVTKWTAGEMPETVEPSESTPTLDERVTALEGSNAEMAEALDLILSGVTE